MDNQNKVITGKDIPIEQSIFTNSWNILKKYYNAKIEEPTVADAFLNDLRTIKEEVKKQGGNERQLKFADDFTVLVLQYIDFKNSK